MVHIAEILRSHWRISSAQIWELSTGSTQPLPLLRILLMRWTAVCQRQCFSAYTLHNHWSANSNYTRGLSYGCTRLPLFRLMGLRLTAVWTQYYQYYLCVNIPRSHWNVSSVQMGGKQGGNRLPVFRIMCLRLAAVWPMHTDGISTNTSHNHLTIYTFFAIKITVLTTGSCVNEVLSILSFLCRHTSQHWKVSNAHMRDKHWQ